MKRSCVFFAALLFAAHLLAQTPAPRPDASGAAAAKGTASIEGHVFTQEGDRPIRKATVMLTPEAPSFSATNLADAMSMLKNVKQTPTDAEGRFEFRELPAGQYRLAVQHPTYVSSKSAKSTSLLVSVADGQQVKDVAMRMVPGAVIKGRVTDEDGDPVAKSLVQALQRTSVRGKVKWVPTGLVLTDDLGEFRLGSLNAGKYYVSAAPAPMPQMGDAGAQARQYVKTFYPSTISRESAGIVEVSGGEEIPVNIQLMKTDTVQVRGTVFAANGSKATGGMVWISTEMEAAPMGGASTMLKDGAFEIRVPPGKYRVMAMLMGDPANPSSMTYAFQSIDVSPDGLQGVKVQTAAGTKVTVRLRTEGNAPAKLSNATLSLVRRSDDEADVMPALFAGSGTGPVTADGTADLGTVANGVYDLTLRTKGAGLEDWYLKSVTVGTHDVAREGLRIGGAAPIQIEAVLSPASARVEGTVETQAARSTIVVAVPDPDRRKNNAAFRTCFVDPAGKFMLRGLEPGRYTLIALENPEPQAWLEPGFLRQVESKGESILVAENERKERVKLQSVATADVKPPAGE